MGIGSDQPTEAAGKTTPAWPASTVLSPASDLPPDEPAADAFPGYRIIRKIHGGGQGVVYEAVNTATRRKVAIKVIREGPLADPRNKARLERGVRILGQLDHPNIVGVIDSGCVAGTLYYVMDFVPGRPLDQHVERWRSAAGSSADASGGGSSGRGDSSRRQRADIEEMLTLFVKICDAVNVAHMRGIIHRDLKPGNIVVDDRGEPHILDFDLAKPVLGDAFDADQAHTMSQTGEFIGSLRWASPEQIERTPSRIDTRTDVYSLGVVLYEMLTGQYPYPVVGSRRDIEDHILRTEPARPSSIRRHLNDELDTILLKCLNKSRERRYQTAGAVADDVRSYQRGAPISAKRDSAWYLLRKVAGRHFVATLVAMCMMATIVACGALSVHFYLEKSYELAERIRSDVQRGRSLQEADARAASAILAWFLREWEAGRTRSARQIMLQSCRPDSLVCAAMRALLEEPASADGVPAQHAAVVAHYVAGERHAKAGRVHDAIQSFELCLSHANEKQAAILVQSARARIVQLRAL